MIYNSRTKYQDQDQELGKLTMDQVTASDESRWIAHIFTQLQHASICVIL